MNISQTRKTSCIFLNFINMFDSEFFPTPAEVASKMFEGYDYEFLRSAVVLEPSAGKGDLVKEYLSRVCRNSSDSLYVIEKNSDLQEVLRGKGYQLLDDDFLTYRPDMEFDLIVMNPPFSNGDEHFLKAWSVAKNTKIACLLNEETLKNPYTQKRKLVLKIIEDNGGTIEYLGDCFASAERSTGVRVALVRVEKKTEAPRVQFEGFEQVDETVEETPQMAIATLNEVETLVKTYELAREHFSVAVQHLEKARELTEGMFEYVENPFDLIAKGYTPQEKVNRFSEMVKQKIWRRVVDALQLRKYMTSKLSQNFDSFLREQSNMALSRKNIMKLVNTILSNSGMILEQSVEEVFDEFTAYHKENRLHVEGWKTNEAWKVNRKVILPYYIETGYFNDCFRISNKYKLADIDRAMCYLSGQQLDRVATLERVLKAKFKEVGSLVNGEKFDNTAESTFFRIRFFKKGTLHIEFKDEWLWKEFNLRACKRKQWLPA